MSKNQGGAPLLLFRWLKRFALTLLGIFAVALIHSMVAELARKLGWDQFLVYLMGPPFGTFLSYLVGQPWFWLLAALSIGLLLGVWATQLLAKRETKKPDSLNTEEPNSLENAAPQIIPPGEREFVSGVEELMQIFDGKTDAQAQLQARSYLGFWLRLSGPLKEFRASDKTVLLQNHFYPESLNHVSMTFREEKWLRRLRITNVGQPLKIVGQIANLRNRWVILNNCELEND